MSTASMKWVLFAVLFLTVPALLFVVQVVMFIPAIFFAAGILIVIPKLVLTAHAAESFWFIVILGVHLLVYAGLYYVISVSLAKAISWIRSRSGRHIAFGILCLGLGLLTLLPVYGSGGHGPIRWVPLSEAGADINSDYGPYTVAIVYGGALLSLGAIILYRRILRGRTRQD